MTPIFWSRSKEWLGKIGENEVLRSPGDVAFKSQLDSYSSTWVTGGYSVFCALTLLSFPSGTMVKNAPANVGDPRDVGSIPESGRSPEVGNGNPCQYSMDREFHGQRSLVGYHP